MSYQTFTALIDDLGGSAGLADILGASVGTASAMKTRDVIPPAHWDAVVRAASERGLNGVSVETLARLYADRRERNREKGAA